MSPMCNSKKVDFRASFFNSGNEIINTRNLGLKAERFDSLNKRTRDGSPTVAGMNTYRRWKKTPSNMVLMFYNKKSRKFKFDLK